MEIGQVKTLFEFNQWANGRALEAASRLSAEQFAKDMGNSFRSVQDTLVHIMGAEWIWLSRCKGTSPKALLPSSYFPSVGHIREHWAGIEKSWEDFIANVTENSLKNPITYFNLKGDTYTYSLGQILQHLVNHSTYHRGQVTTMLRQLGAKPEATDFLVFLDIKSRTLKTV